MNSNCNGPWSVCRVAHLLIAVMLLYQTVAVGCSRVTEDDSCDSQRCHDNSCPRQGLFCSRENGECFSFGKTLFRKCEGLALCASDGYSCPGEKCGSGEFTCADETCVPIYTKCPDGSSGCEHDERRCQSGRCLGTGSRCMEDPCTEDKPYKCLPSTSFEDETIGLKIDYRNLINDESACHPMSIICDGIDQCQDGDDEMGCDEGPNNLLYLLFLLVIPVACCGYCCYLGCISDDEDKKDKNQTDGTDQERTELNTLGSLTNQEVTELNQVDQTYIAPTAIIYNDSKCAQVV